MKTKSVFKLKDLSENNLRIRGERLQIAHHYLEKLGFNSGTMANRLSMYKRGKTEQYAHEYDGITKTKWIFLNTIPKRVLGNFEIPIKEEVLKKEISKMEYATRHSEELKEVWSILNRAWYAPYAWKQYVPIYAGYYLDQDVRRLYAKTHSVFQEIILLKKGHKMVDIFMMYLKLDSIIGRVENYKHFCSKVLRAEREGIDQVLVHGNKRFGRKNYKLSPFAQSRLKFYYSSTKRYSRKVIYSKVNQELLEKEYPTISYSTVCNFLASRTIQNQCNILRYGEENTRKTLMPYLSRKEPRHLGEIFQVDSTVLNMHTRIENKLIARLRLCVVMDVYTRRIIGHSLAVSENNEMILDALKMAFTNFRIIPKQILYDNHKAYYSKEFGVFKDSMEEYGVVLRSSRIKNAQDKAQVERWFKTFQTSYLYEAFGHYGNGIKSKEIDSRASKELETIYQQKRNLRDFFSMEKLIAKLIDKYNSDIADIRKEILKPYRGARKFRDSDLAKIFFESTILTVRRSKLILRANKNKYEYTIKNELLAEKVNNTKVVVRYSPSDLSEIYLFDLDKSIFLGCLQIDYLINIVASEKDMEVIKAHNKMVNDRINSKIERLMKEFEEGKLELKSLPTQMFNSPESLSRVLAQAEDELLIMDTLPSNSKIKKDLKRKVEERSKDITKRYFKKNRGVKILKIER